MKKEIHKIIRKAQWFANKVRSFTTGIQVHSIWSNAVVPRHAALTLAGFDPPIRWSRDEGRETWNHRVIRPRYPCATGLK